VLFSMISSNRISDGNERLTPDFSAERARRTFVLYMPGVTPSLLLFVVFATTKQCIEYMKSCFITKHTPAPTAALPIPKIITGASSPTSSTHKILKPDNSYHSMLHNDGHSYDNMQATDSLELRQMKPLSATSQSYGVLSNGNTEPGFLNHPRFPQTQNS
jgi:hypothetical protein